MTTYINLFSSRNKNYFTWSLSLEPDYNATYTFIVFDYNLTKNPMHYVAMEIEELNSNLKRCYDTKRSQTTIERTKKAFFNSIVYHLEIDFDIKLL